MRPGTVRERDLGWNRIKRELEYLDSHHVKVGIQSDEGAHDAAVGLTVAEIGTIHEYGIPPSADPSDLLGSTAPSADQLIPTRSFIRSAVDENRRRILTITRKLYTKVLDGKMTGRIALELLGQAVEAMIKRKITSGPFVPLAPSTIAKRTGGAAAAQYGGGHRPLIDTGQLRASIRYLVSEGGLTPRRRA